MWGRLAGQLGGQDLNSTLKKLGDAVAPPADGGDYDDDDGVYDDGEEGYYDDEDEYYDDEEEEGAEGSKGGLGLVGILARALDDSRPQDDGDDADYADYADGEGEYEGEDGHDGGGMFQSVFQSNGAPKAAAGVSVAPSSAPKPRLASIMPAQGGSHAGTSVMPPSSAATAPALSTAGSVAPSRESAREERRRQRQERLQKQEAQLQQLDTQNTRPVRADVDVNKVEQQAEMPQMGAEPQDAVTPAHEQPADTSDIRAVQMEQQKQLEQQLGMLQQKLVDEAAQRTRQVEAEALQRQELLDQQRLQQEQELRLQQQQWQQRMDQLQLQRERAQTEAAELRDQMELMKQAQLEANDRMLELSKQLAQSAQQQDQAAQSFQQEHDKMEQMQQKHDGEMQSMAQKLSAEQTQRAEIQAQHEQQIKDLSDQLEKTTLSAAATFNGTEQAEAADNGVSLDIQAKDQRIGELEEQCKQLQADLELAKASQASGEGKGESEQTQQLEQPIDDKAKAKVEELEERCQQMELQLTEARGKMEEAQHLAQQQVDAATAEKEQLMLSFQTKEARLMEASSEDHQNEMLRIKDDLLSQIHHLEAKAAEERKAVVLQQQEFKQLLHQMEQRAEDAESRFQRLSKQHDRDLTQADQREKNAIRMVEDKMAQTLAMLDDREVEVSRLQKMVDTLKSSMKEHKEDADEADEEINQLHKENEELQAHLHNVEAAYAQMQSKTQSLEQDATMAGSLQMELTMMREELSRERSKNQSAVQSAISSHSQVEMERDEALAGVRDLKQQLAATLGDLEIAKADCERITMASTNLQTALEAFQDEREAEMRLTEEHRLDLEEAIRAAHATAIEAIKQTHMSEMKQVQAAADAAVRNSMEEVTLLERKISSLKTENLQTRRSLDEAIHRLQTTQEDVIDRTLMKNILLDWCTMKEKTKRQQVLELMASVLHFTEEEREKVHLTHMDIESVRNRIVGAVAAPLPETKADIEHLEGQNVREKWVNFLLAETDDAM